MAHSTVSSNAIYYGSTVHDIIASLPEHAMQHLISLACNEGPMAIVKSLFANPCVDHSSNKSIDIAAKNAQYDIVQFLLKESQVNPEQKMTYQLLVSSISGDVAKVCEILGDSNHEFDFPSRTPLYEACTNGHTEVAKLLLNDNRMTDLYSELGDGNWLLSDLADDLATMGLTEMLHLLVSDPRSNPGLCKAVAFEYYCAGGDIRRVQLMLEDPDYDPSAHDYPNQPLAYACENGRDDVVQVLLADPRIYPSRLKSMHPTATVLGRACAAGRNGVVNLLLAHPGVDASEKQNIAIKEASKHDNASMVELLLVDPHVIAAGGEHSALIHASKYGALHVLQMLLARPGIVLTKEALIAAEYWSGYSLKNPESVVNIFIAEQPMLVSKLCSDGGMACERNGAIHTALGKWAARSAKTLLLSVKRTQTPIVAGRLADVLRDVLSEFTPFYVVYA